MSWMIFTNMENAINFIAECDSLLGLPKTIIEGKQIVETWAVPDTWFLDNKIGVRIPPEYNDYNFLNGGVKYEDVSSLRPPETEN